MKNSKDYLKHCTKIFVNFTVGSPLSREQVRSSSTVPWVSARAHKNGRLEEERVTPIEACSPVKIIEPY